MRISDWSSDVCSSDLLEHRHQHAGLGVTEAQIVADVGLHQKESRGDPMDAAMPEADQEDRSLAFEAEDGRRGFDCRHGGSPGEVAAVATLIPIPSPYKGKQGRPRDVAL